MAPGAGDALTEPQVRPRAVRDRGLRSQQHVQLGIVDVHPVGDQHVAAERAQAIEMDERPVAGARQVRRRSRSPSARCGT